MGKTKILATGVTGEQDDLPVDVIALTMTVTKSGYIGGSVLNELLNSPNFSKVEVTAVVRSPEKAEKLKELGINVVIGSLTDRNLMEKLAEETDLVLAMVMTLCSAGDI
jgi:nucleoside-diphosphate-sugar epimerase